MSYVACPALRPRAAEVEVEAAVAAEVEVEAAVAAEVEVEAAVAHHLGLLAEGFRHRQSRRSCIPRTWREANWRTNDEQLARAPRFEWEITSEVAVLSLCAHQIVQWTR